MAIYLTLDGIDGPISKPADGVDKAIELNSVSFGVGCHLTKEKGQGFKRQKEPAISEISVGKISDKATTNLFKEICGGTFFKKGEITVTKLVGGTATPFFKLSMEEVFISGWSISSGGESPSESLSMAFNKVKVSFNAEEDGKLAGFVDAGWDLKADAKW